MKRAAIYSRKSLFTGKGESIENQIELCRNYLERYYPDVTDFSIYEDEGFTGGNTNRPKFQQLLKDIKSGCIDVLICYRLDRISRSVADFATTYNMLEEHNVAFVSLKEQFDTSTPMGKAMLYISSVFAQLERETIAERVKDNMLLLSKTGRWLGGQEPFGFTSEKVSYIDENYNERTLMKLAPIEEELNVVKLIYTKYNETNSITQVTNYLQDNMYKGKNGGEWQTSQVQRILSSPLYVRSSDSTHEYLRSLGINVYGEANGNGYLTYNKTKKMTIDRDISEWIYAVANHEGIIDSSEWILIQKTLNKNSYKKVKRLGTGSNNNALLTGILKCHSCGANMIIKQGHKSKTEDGVRYDYYVCSSKDNSRGKKCTNKNIRVDRLDKIVTDQLFAYNRDTLNKYLLDLYSDATKLNLKNNKADSIISDIKEKEAAINTLIKQLSQATNETVSNYIMQEINKLSDEVTSLKKSLETKCEEKENVASDIKNLKIILDQFDKLESTFKLTEDINTRRLLLQTILTKVTWDGENYEAELTILEDKKNSS